MQEDAKNRGAVMRPDIVGFDRNGQIRLVAEVKNRRGVSSEWAARLRGNLSTATPPPKDAFFLLVFPDKLFLWKPSAPVAHDVRPDVSATVPKWLSEHSSSTSALEFSTFGWLSDLTRLTSPEGLRDNPLWEWAFSSGLAESLRGGRVEIEPQL